MKEYWQKIVKEALEKVHKLDPPEVEKCRDETCDVVFQAFENSEDNLAKFGNLVTMIMNKMPSLTLVYRMGEK